MNTISPESDFLHKLFAALNAAQVRYAVMRNYDSLPHSSGGSDLDIYINPSEVEDVESLLIDVVSIVSAEIVGAVRTFNFIEFYVVGYFQGVWWGVCVEFYTDIVFKSAMPLVNKDYLMKFLDVHNNISIFPYDIGNAIGYIKEILVHNEFRMDKQKYKESAYLLAKQEHNFFNDIFSPLGLQSRNLLLSVIESNSRCEEIFNLIKFRFYARYVALSRNPLLFLLKRLKHEFFRYKRFFNPPGVFIAILGTDGSGKSTLIEAILPALNAATHNAVFVRHLRPSLLPPLSRLKGKANVPDGPVLDPHGSTPSGRLGSLLRLIYLTLDYLAGYWLWTRPTISKRPAVVIFDRYAYDMMLDPRRFRIGLSARVSRWFASLAPKPDLIVCLHGNPEVIVARKQELTLDETCRQVEALRAFASKESRAVLISTDTSVEETRDQVLRTLCMFLRDKAKKSLA